MCTVDLFKRIRCHCDIVFSRPVIIKILRHIFALVKNIYLTQKRSKMMPVFFLLTFMG